MKKRHERLVMQLSFSFLIYALLGAVGLVIFLSDANQQAKELFSIVIALVTLATVKITNCFGFLPRLSRCVDRYFEGIVVIVMILGPLILVLNGYVPIMTGVFVKPWW